MPALPPAPPNAGSLRGVVSEFAIPPIERFSSAIVGDGVTDDSAAIKAAHDAAAAAGIRELYCSKSYYAPSAYNLGAVQFRGPGALLGAYRKRVIPLTARSMTKVGPRLVPALHLPRFAKALAPTVVVWGDSTGTTAANHISASEMLWPYLMRVLTRDNPGRTINFVNRSIGGTDWSQYNATGTALIAAGVTLPSFFTPQSAPWTGFVSNQSPDLVIINWGTNNPSAVNTFAISTVVSFLQGLAKVPDILLVTNLPRSTQADTGSAQVAALEARDQAAGIIRSFAEYQGIGLLDLHRVGCCMRDGFDPCSQVMTQNGASGSFNLPATLPMTQQDYNLTFTIDNTGGAAFGAGQTLAVQISPASGNYIVVKQSANLFQILGYDGAAGLLWLGIFTTGITCPTSLCTIEISLRGNWATVNLNGFLAWQGLVRRLGGQFQPVISYTSGSGPASISVTQYVASSPSLVAPAITDFEMFGSGGFLQGGNGINHPASGAYEAIHAIVLDDIETAGMDAGQPTQAIAGATAINRDCSLVQLTGPASGTYAITLAAPRVQDRGRMLAIEMLATTATNTVTLALAGVVTGGTASTTCTWSAANQRLVLIALTNSWEVIKQDGVTLV